MLKAGLMSQLELLASDPIIDLPPIAATNALDLSGWEEGVEEFSSFSENRIWAELGLEAKKFPFFNPQYDPCAIIDPWTLEGRLWVEDGAHNSPLQLQWHQMVGVLKMVHNAFEGLPVLLMDGVGLGKTIQVAAVIAVLTYYREFYAAHDHFPGCFRKFFRLAFVTV